MADYDGGVSESIDERDHDVGAPGTREEPFDAVEPAVTASSAEPEDDASDEELGLRERKKRQTRIAMHRAALELVAEEGSANVTAEMIARRAGVSTRTFFNHWSSKESSILGIIAGKALSVAELLRGRPADEAPGTALRIALRESVEAVPADPDLSELKKQVMAKEPKLQSLSTGNLNAARGELIEALTERLDGPDVHERAVVTAHLAFAMTRSAFVLSMSTGTPPGIAFDRVLEMYDARTLVI